MKRFNISENKIRGLMDWAFQQGRTCESEWRYKDKRNEKVGEINEL